ncbi:MAG: hypothetical protein WCS65_06645 [Verrucomicrobiae bacterium]
MKKPFLILAAAAAGICQAMPNAFDLAGAISSAGRGSLGGAWSDRLVAASLGAGGWAGAEIVRSAWAAAPWALGFLVLFFAAEKAAGPWRRRAGICVWVLWGASAVNGLWSGWLAWQYRLGDIRLLAPVALVERVKASPQRVFINPPAVAMVASLAPSLVDQELLLKPIVQSPASWKEEDRRRPFSAVLLSGGLAEAKPLIRHLLDSPDWHLAALDNQGVVFLRGASPDRSEAEIPTFSSPRDEAVFLAQYALCLDAAGFGNRATQRMDEAMKTSGSDFEVLVRASTLAASRKRWEQARKLADKALLKRPGNFEAEYLLAWSLLEMRASGKAFEMTSRLAESFPGSFPVLLLHARASRAAKDFSAETEALEKILRLARDDKGAAARIHLFLGQSWAQRGFPDQALAHYRLALDGSQGPEESRDIREAIKAIESNRLPAAPR